MKKSIIAAAFICLAGSVQAEQAPHWDSISLSYNFVDLDGLDLSGPGLSGSKLLNENVFVAASYSHVSDEVQLTNDKVDIDVDTWSIGIGWRHGLSATTDLYGLLSYEEAEAELSTSNFSLNSSGENLTLRGGLRSMVTDRVELSGALGVQTDSGSSEAILEVGGRYYLTEQTAIGAGYVRADDVNQAALSLSFDF